MSPQCHPDQSSHGEGSLCAQVSPPTSQCPAPALVHTQYLLPQGRRAADVCLVCRAGSRGPDAVACEVHRLLTGLELGRELQRRGDRHTEDNAEFPVSSVDEDFLSASEHLGDNGEEGAPQTGDYTNQRSPALFTCFTNRSRSAQPHPSHL